MSITQDKDFDDQITGGTDGTIIGNIGDALKVTNQANPVAPGQQIVHFYEPLLNAGSERMEVNGSVTPVVFSAAPAAGQTWYVIALQLALADSGTSDANDFGSINGGLTNGLLIEQVLNSTNYQVNNVFDNADIVSQFAEFATFKGSGGQFIRDANFYSGASRFTPVITLVGDNSDKLQITVRDNLSVVDLLEAHLHYWRIV